MTQEFTAPDYIDHRQRGGLKLRPMFSSKNGVTMLELVCPELRKLDRETTDGFLDIVRDRMNDTLRDMRRASPDGKIDCHLVAPKPGYKLDRITLKGDRPR